MDFIFLTPNYVTCIKVSMVKKQKTRLSVYQKGSENIKIHAIKDVLENLISFLLSFGNDHDSKHYITCL